MDDKKDRLVYGFRMALEANGERHGGGFERELLEKFIKAFPELHKELLDEALDWLNGDTEPGNISDVAMARLKQVHKRVMDERQG